MSKTWQTKEKIIVSLKEKNKTLTGLSEELGLSPSTISQHLHELLRTGRVVEANLSKSKKWKYYRINVALEMNQTKEPTGAGARARTTFFF